MQTLTFARPGTAGAIRAAAVGLTACLTLAASLYLAGAGVAYAHDRPLCLPDGRVVGPTDAPIGPYNDGHHERYEAFKHANGAREMGDGDRCVAPATSTPTVKPSPTATAVPPTPTTVPPTPTTVPPTPTSTPGITVAAPTSTTGASPVPTVAATSIPAMAPTSTTVPAVVAVSTPASNPPASNPPAQTQEAPPSGSGPSEPSRRVICENLNGPRMVELSEREIAERQRQGGLINDGPCPTPTRQPSPTATAVPATPTSAPVVSPPATPAVLQPAVTAPTTPPAPPVVIREVAPPPTPAPLEILGPLLVVEQAPEPTPEPAAEPTPAPVIQVLQPVSQSTATRAPIVPSRPQPVPAAERPATPLLPRTGAGGSFGPGALALTLLGLGALLSQRAVRR